MGNHANKRAAAAAHNARYAEWEAVRPNIAKVDRFKGVNIGTVGEVDSGLKQKPLAGTVSLTWEDGQFKQIKPQKKPSLFQRFAAYLKTKLIGR